MRAQLGGNKAVANNLSDLHRHQPRNESRNALATVRAWGLEIPQNPPTRVSALRGAGLLVPAFASLRLSLIKANPGKK